MEEENQEEVEEEGERERERDGRKGKASRIRNTWLAENGRGFVKYTSVLKFRLETRWDPVVVEGQDRMTARGLGSLPLF